MEERGKGKTTLNGVLSIHSPDITKGSVLQRNSGRQNRFSISQSYHNRGVRKLGIYLSAPHPSFVGRCFFEC